MSTQKREKPIVFGVLVTHAPDKELAARVEGHLAQLSHLCVVCNAAAPEIAQSLNSIKNVSVLTNEHNNLAAAQNMGITHARAHGADYVLLLDDDSEMADNMLTTLLCHAADDVGLIAPVMQDRGTARQTSYAATFWRLGFSRRNLSFGDIMQNAFNPIASGSLIPVSVLARIGDMDERFVIDYIDREFCLRLLSRGYRTLVVGDAQLFHRIGHSEDHELLGARVTTTNHSPARRYYIYRNRLHCWARYGCTHPGFVVYDALGIGYDLVRIILFERNKAAKLAAMLGGICDAIIGTDRHALPLE